MKRLVLLMLIIATGIYSQSVIDYRDELVQFDENKEYLKFSYYSPRGKVYYKINSFKFPYSDDIFVVEREKGEVGSEIIQTLHPSSAASKFIASIAKTGKHWRDYFLNIISFIDFEKFDPAILGLNRYQLSAFNEYQTQSIFLHDLNSKLFLTTGATNRLPITSNPSTDLGAMNFLSKGVLTWYSSDLSTKHSEFILDRATNIFDISPSGLQTVFIRSTWQDDSQAVYINADIYSPFQTQGLDVVNVLTDQKTNINIDTSELVDLLDITSITKAELAFRYLDVNFINEHTVLVELDYGRVEGVNFVNPSPILGLLYSIDGELINVYKNYYGGNYLDRDRNENSVYENHKKFIFYGWDLTFRYFLQSGQVYRIENNVTYKSINSAVGASGIIQLPADILMSLLPNPTILHTMQSNDTFTVIDTYEGPTGFDPSPAKYYKILPENGIAGWIRSDHVTILND